MRNFLFLGAATCVTFGAVYGCGQKSATFDAGSDTDTGTPPEDDGSSLPPIDGGDGGDCTKCSPDLHSVLDCDDNLLYTCPPDQGCGGGGCVPACDSASANKSSIGCDYYAIPADGWSNIPEFNAGTSDGSCFAAFVTNTWGSPITVQLEFDGKSVDGTSHAYIPKGSGTAITYQPVGSGGIPKDQMAIVFLAHYGSPAIYKTLCPTGVSPAITNVDVGVHGTGKGHAVRIKTSYPAVIYDIYPYGGAATYTVSATLLLPTPAWDTNYVGVTAWNGSTLYGGRPSSLAFVAKDPGTQVTISPTGDIPARSTTAYGTVAGTSKGVPKTYSLNAGEVLQFATTADLSGSIIQSNYPIGMWGGHYCMNIPDTASACDAAHMEIPPVKALGNEYVAVAHRPRSGSDNPPWRMVGAVNGTTLTYDPPIATAPKTLKEGELVEFDADKAFTVKSQDISHPFYLAGHMTGASAGGGGSMGDPETVNTVPPDQYLSSYIFFTDPTYAETNLVVTRKKTGSGFVDVSLDCAGVLKNWTPIGSNGQYQFTRVDLQLLGQKAGSCDNGRHEIKSTAPFGITVWGFDTTVSYAYPAGASVRPINSVVIKPLPK